MCECANLSVSAAARPSARGWRVHLSPRLCSQNVCVLVVELVRVHVGVPARVVWFGVNELGGWEEEEMAWLSLIRLLSVYCVPRSVLSASSELSFL